MLDSKLKNPSRGAVLFLSIIVLSVLFAIALGVSTILVGQVRQLQGMESSVHAFFAADTGIEQALFEEQAVSGVLTSGATYQVQLFPPGPECSFQNYCLKSVGAFRESRRAIESSR